MADLAAALRGKLTRAFDLTAELAAALEPAALGQRLPVRSNRIGSQLWCVVGARESYARAIAAGGWQGFACSLSDAQDPAGVREALDRSRAAAEAATADVGALGEAAQDLALDLLEHEVQHHGQLIRYLYGLGIPIPAGWQRRYALSP